MAARLLGRMAINKPHKEKTHHASDELADKKDGESNSVSITLQQATAIVTLENHWTDVS